MRNDIHINYGCNYLSMPQSQYNHVIWRIGTKRLLQSMLTYCQSDPKMSGQLEFEAKDKWFRSIIMCTKLSSVPRSVVYSRSVSYMTQGTCCTGIFPGPLSLGFHGHCIFKFHFRHLLIQVNAFWAPSQYQDGLSRMGQWIYPICAWPVNILYSDLDMMVTADLLASNEIRPSTGALFYKIAMTSPILGFKFFWMHFTDNIYLKLPNISRQILFHFEN